MNETTPELALHTALEHHRAGRLDEAEAIYRHVLQARPDDADALHLLGVIAHQRGRDAEACGLIERAIARNGGVAAYDYNLAEALQCSGRFAEAESAYRRALEREPDHGDAHDGLARLLIRMHRADEAVAEARRAIECAPSSPSAHYDLGTALLERRDWSDAACAFERAVALHANHANALHNLAVARMELGQLDAAADALERAMRLDGGDAGGWNNLGNLRKSQGRLDEAIACFRRAVDIDPSQSGIHSNLLLAMAYHDGLSAREIFDEHVRWAARHADPLRASGGAHANDRSPDRTLRIGYLSADFRQHPVGFFIEPLIGHHHRESVEVVCYSDVATPDALTARLQAKANLWRPIAGIDDAAVADLVRQDAIDVLVDLAGHTAHNRMLVFARKPAPVQVTYLGYTTTTGLTTMDCALTDQFLDPPGAHEGCRTERLCRLPRTYVCYVPPMQCPAVGELPALARGFVTFACMNNFAKVTPRALQTWAELLRAVPESRLVLHAAASRQLDETRQLIADAGVDPSRVEFVGKRPLNEYFSLHNTFDIALDPFPHNGGTTTCDALWMGVPVVSIRGELAVMRAGLSLLSTIGLQDLVAYTTHGYVEYAELLARQLPRLAELRRTMRQRMLSSPLMDADGYARDVEDAYRAMWRTWCNA